MLMVSDKTGMGWLRFLKSKDETAKVFRAFVRDVAEVENLSIGCVRTDEGTEFKNVGFEDVLDEHKIRHEYTVPGAPQLYGKVERALALIVEKGLVMMHAAGLGDRLGL
ncbi:unnamed protein product [Choristocarpus tenellus]